MSNFKISLTKLLWTFWKFFSLFEILKLISGHSLINKLLNVLEKPKTWNGRPASAEYFADACLKYSLNKPQSYIDCKAVILEVGTNYFDINRKNYNYVESFTIDDSFESLLRTLGRYVFATSDFQHIKNIFSV